MTITTPQMIPYLFETGHSALFGVGKSWPLNIYTCTKTRDPENPGELEFFLNRQDRNTQNGINAADQQNGKLVTTYDPHMFVFPA